MTPTFPDLMREDQAAAYLTEVLGLQIGPGGLRMRRHRGTGPAFVRYSSRTIRYRKADLDAWGETVGPKGGKP